MKENKINMFCKMKFGNKNVNLVDCFIFKFIKFYVFEMYRCIKRVIEVCRFRYNFILFKLFVKKVLFVCIKCFRKEFGVVIVEEIFDIL